MIQIDHVSYTYPDGSEALKDLSLKIEPGQTTAIIGANGAGKSTLLQLLCGLLLPSSGSISISGIELKKSTFESVRKKTGYLFQNPDDQLLMATVYEDIAFSLRNRMDNENLIKQKTNEMLEHLNLSHLKNKPPHKLSWGEKRMAAIAGLLIVNPEVLLLDEPTSFLDIRARKSFIDASAKIPVTKIIATHDLEMALFVSDTVVVLSYGKVLMQGEPQEILSNAELMEKAFLMVLPQLQKCPHCGKTLF